MGAGRPCRVCSHPRRQEIDSSLRAGASVSMLATLHGIAETNVRRHKSNHLVGAAAEAPVQEASEMMRLLIYKALRVAREAEGSGNPGAALRALRIVGEQLAIAAKVKAAEPPAYDPLRDDVIRQIRDAFSGALRPFPDAAAAVAKALRNIVQRDTRHRPPARLDAARGVASNLKEWTDS